MSLETEMAIGKVIAPLIVFYFGLRYGLKLYKESKKQKEPPLKKKQRELDLKEEIKLFREKQKD